MSSIRYFNLLHCQCGLRVYSCLPVFFVLFDSFVPWKFLSLCHCEVIVLRFFPFRYVTDKFYY